MANTAKYVWAALLVAVAVHFAIVHAVPRVLMDAAIERLSGGRYNSWRFADRVTEHSRTIVRPAPDFAYSACPYDLREGPLVIAAAPWDSYWSLSLYAANSDNYYVVDDREARNGVEITLIRRGASRPDGAAQIVESPSRRGIALIRRLAPTLDDYNRASVAARDDICATLGTLAG